MNLAHVHLLLNHVPTVGFGVGLGLLVLSLVGSSHDDLKRASLMVLFVVAILTIPTFLERHGRRGGAARHEPPPPRFRPASCRARSGGTRMRRSSPSRSWRSPAASRGWRSGSGADADDCRGGTSRWSCCCPFVTFGLMARDRDDWAATFTIPRFAPFRKRPAPRRRRAEADPDAAGRIGNGARDWLVGLR